MRSGKTPCKCFAGTPRIEGYTQSSRPPSLTAAKWRFHTGGKIFASPTIANGVAYAGSGDGNLYAVRAGDGSLVWKFATQGPVNSSPAIVGRNSFSEPRRKRLCGERERWTGTLALQDPGRAALHGSRNHGIIPIYRDDAGPVRRVSVVADGRRRDRVYRERRSSRLRARCRDRNAALEVYDRRRGPRCRQRLPAASCTSGAGIGSCMRSTRGPAACAGSSRPATIARSTTKSAFPGSAAVDRGTVYFGCRDSFFYALDAATGKLRWKHDEHGSWVVASPAISGRRRLLYDLR